MKLVHLFGFIIKKYYRLMFVYGVLLRRQ